LIPLANELSIPDDYPQLLEQLKERIRTAQVRAALSVNRELVLLYWNIGTEIRARQRQSGWGSKVIDRLSDDLRREFPDVKGFSTRNLKYMRSFADAWPEEPIVQAALAQITWYHNITLIEKVKDSQQRLWYAQQTVANGWSRNVLVHQIDTGLYARQAQATTNFATSLPTPQSDLAQQILKDPYNFEFLTIAKDAHENELQRGLLEHLRDFMIELGVGFSYVGSNVHLDVGGDDFYLDLLFYHLKLRCFVVIELKTGKFKPEYAGKMNFYLAAVDDLLRHEDDHPSIGIILCRSKNKVIVEYSLRNLDKPIGVPEYRLTEALPEDLAAQLPSVEQLQNELRDAPNPDEVKPND
jgi:predicted nuclease of restriction endonuclease-like (RecB) superfamily